MVVDGQQRVDESLLAFLLIVAPDDLRLQSDLAEERQSEEDADDPAIDDEGGNRVKIRHRHTAPLSPEQAEQADDCENENDDDGDEHFADDGERQQHGRSPFCQWPWSRHEYRAPSSKYWV